MCNLCYACRWYCFVAESNAEKCSRAVSDNSVMEGTEEKKITLTSLSIFIIELFLFPEAQIAILITCDNFMFIKCGSRFSGGSCMHPDKAWIIMLQCLLFLLSSLIKTMLSFTWKLSIWRLVNWCFVVIMVVLCHNWKSCSHG